MKKSILFLHAFITFTGLVLGSQSSYAQEAEQKKHQYSILEKDENEKKKPDPVFTHIFCGWDSLRNHR